MSVIKHINRIGESVEIWRRSKTGEDELGNPVYTWQKQSTPVAVIQSLKGEHTLLATGEATLEDRLGFFKPDTDILAGDRVVADNATYEVKNLVSRKIRGRIVYKECLLKRVVE